MGINYSTMAVGRPVSAPLAAQGTGSGEDFIQQDSLPRSFSAS
jgi:hypothetical protein